MRERSAVRVTPRSAVTVAIGNQGLPRAYGVVANISEAGACVWTNGPFQPGESLVFRLSFAREPLPLQAPGRIVWTDAAAASRNALRLGLRWAETPSLPQARLRVLIGSSI